MHFFRTLKKTMAFMWNGLTMHLMWLNRWWCFNSLLFVFILNGRYGGGRGSGFVEWCEQRNHNGNSCHSSFNIFISTYLFQHIYATFNYVIIIHRDNFALYSFKCSFKCFKFSQSHMCIIDISTHRTRQWGMLVLFSFNVKSFQFSVMRLLSFFLLHLICEIFLIFFFYKYFV